MTHAQDYVYQARRDGKLIPGPCEVGGDCKGNIEAHHDDYSRALDVRWLCQRHHQMFHARARCITGTRLGGNTTEIAEMILASLEVAA